MAGFPFFCYFFSHPRCKPPWAVLTVWFVSSFPSMPVEHLLENSACPVSFQNQQPTEVWTQGGCQHSTAAATRLPKDRISPAWVRSTFRTRVRDTALQKQEAHPQMGQTEQPAKMWFSDHWHKDRMIIACYLVEDSLFWDQVLLFRWRLTTDQ